MYKLATFDFDGTIVDSTSGIVSVMKMVVEQNKLPLEVWESWSQMIGVPLYRQIETLFPDTDQAYRDKIIADYRTIYDERTVELCPPFPDLRALLDELKQAGVLFSIATSKRGVQVANVLAHYGLTEYFSLVISAQDVVNHKPHPESMFKTLKLLEIDKSEAVVIGDSTYDLDMASAAGVDAVGVTTGVHSSEVLARSKPKHIIQNLRELTGIVLGN